MKSILIGSEALRSNGIHVVRNRLDVDLIADIEFVKHLLQQLNSSVKEVRYTDDASHVFIFTKSSGVIYDIELAWPGSTGEHLIDLFTESDKQAKKFYTIGEATQIPVATPSVVLALKLSHKYKKNSQHFLKTMRDIQMLKEKGYKIPKYLSEWLKLRKKETYSYKHPKLKDNTKDGFFTGDGVTYYFEHDSIHEAVKHLDKPAYRYYQPDGEEVHTSKEDFDMLPKSIRLLGVLEESYVLSLERSIIPFKIEDTKDRKKSFDMALMKVCTSITSGYFRKFAYDNYDTIQSMYDQEYVDRFLKAVERGEVDPYDPNKNNLY